MSQENESLLRSNGVSYVLPFILITSCFALWGFANDITNPMVKAFSKIFRMSGPAVPNAGGGPKQSAMLAASSCES